MKIFYISLAFSGVAAVEQGQRGIEGFLGKGAPATSISPLGDPEIVEEQKTVQPLSYQCPSCAKVISTEVDPSDDSDILSRKLDILKAEHEDFHFAQKLAHQDKVVIGGGATKRKHNADLSQTKKKRKAEGSIANYFQKKW